MLDTPTASGAQLPEAIAVRGANASRAMSNFIMRLVLCAGAEKSMGKLCFGIAGCSKRLGEVCAGVSGEGPQKEVGRILGPTPHDFFETLPPPPHLFPYRETCIPNPGPRIDRPTTGILVRWPCCRKLATDKNWPTQNCHGLVTRCVVQDGAQKVDWHDRCIELLHLRMIAGLTYLTRSDLGHDAPFKTGEAQDRARQMG